MSNVVVEARGLRCAIDVTGVSGSTRERRNGDGVGVWIRGQSVASDSSARLCGAECC